MFSVSTHILDRNLRTLDIFLKEKCSNRIHGFSFLYPFLLPQNFHSPKRWNILHQQIICFSVSRIIDLIHGKQKFTLKMQPIFKRYRPIDKVWTHMLSPTSQLTTYVHAHLLRKLPHTLVKSGR